ncbi:MAG: cobalamin-binding protein [Peptococcaceae bacterium]|nr:cobalamin-binding protein [Peptococcaceae bacterium]
MKRIKKIKKLVITLIVLMFVFSLTAGCFAQEQEVPQGKTIKDSLGREIAIPQTPAKIISLSPALTELLFALDLDQQIIGVSDYCDYPEQVKTKERMGGYNTPNVELIASKNPDLVFISAGVQEEFMDRLSEFGITVVSLDADTIDQVMTNIHLAGVLTGKEKEAKQLTDSLKQKKDEITAKVQGKPKPKVFYEVWDDPLMSAGAPSFIHDIIETAGGINIAAESNERYYIYSVEKLLEENPDIYIINSHSHIPKDVMSRNGYQALKAVQNNKVYVIDDNLISRAGPRVIEGLEQMAQMLHPEVFATE